MRKKLTAVILTLALFFTSACSASPEECTVPLGDSSAVSYEDSVLKHITNGGVTEDEKIPYNIDAITGATMTIEGPGIVTSIPLSVREMENRSDGYFRGIYKDKRGSFVYEGLDLYYLLHEMTMGDNGILLTDTASRVILKNANRAAVAEFSLKEVEKAHNDGRPILLASGISTLDGRYSAPFVFSAANEGEHSLGYIDKLKNDDGCTKLVYDLDSYGSNTDYRQFSNVAYVYVCENSEPGFKHTDAEGSDYSSSRYTDYVISFRGTGLGRELTFTDRELENLVVYDSDGRPAEGGMGYRDQYSLANTSYWYVNEYEGLKLYDLLLYLGMEDAETMGPAAARTTLVKFLAADGRPATETFSVDTLSYPDAFGFYNKNAADMSDGTYQPSNADLVKTGYPVLVSYGVNNYPYTIHKTDPSYLSGLANSGGPMRVVFGKTQYFHANGSSQVQYLRDVVVGDDIYYSSHKYTDDSACSALASAPLSVKAVSESGQILMENEFTAGDIEDMVLGEDAGPEQKKLAHVKEIYETSDGEEPAADCYEGIDLHYFLMNILSLPGTNGTVNFSDGENSVSLSIDELFRPGFNTGSGRGDLHSILAFAKNGSPLVLNEESDGYIETVPLNPYLDSDPAEYSVRNSGGPLKLIVPSASADSPEDITLNNVRSIEIQLIPDSYAHIEKPYNALAGSEIRLYGEGLEEERVYTAEDIESMQTKVETLDFPVPGSAGEEETVRYRGIPIYELFVDTGIKNNAGNVIVYSSDGSSFEYSLSDMKKSIKSSDGSALCALLSYGKGIPGEDIMSGYPLVRESSDEGYSEKCGNTGGPFCLVMPRKDSGDENTELCIKDVTAVEVTANNIEGWGHRMSDVYGEYLDYEITFTVKNDDSEWTHVFTVDQLEQLREVILRDDYTVLDLGTCEGLDIWKFARLIAGDAPGIDDPVSFTVYAEDGFKSDLLSVFYKTGLENGISGDTGDPKKIIIAYAINGCPLVHDEGHEGYTGLAGNTAGPMRIICETNQGASVKYFNKLVITVPGSGAIDVKFDESIFDAEG